jgi:hypothetical protein
MSEYQATTLARYFWIWGLLMALVTLLHLQGPRFTDHPLESKLIESFSKTQAVVPNDIYAHCDIKGTTYEWRIVYPQSDKVFKHINPFKICDTPSETYATYSGVQWAHINGDVFNISSRGQYPPLYSETTQELADIWHKLSRQMSHTAPIFKNTNYAWNVQALSYLLLFFETVLVVVSLILIELIALQYKANQKKRPYTTWLIGSITLASAFLVCTSLPTQLTPSTAFTGKPSELTSLVNATDTPNWHLKNMQIACIGGKFKVSGTYAQDDNPTILKTYSVPSTQSCSMLPHSHSITLDIQGVYHEPTIQYSSQFLHGNELAAYDLKRYYSMSFSNQTLLQFAKSLQKAHLNSTLYNLN